MLCNKTFFLPLPAPLYMSYMYYFYSLFLYRFFTDLAKPISVRLKRNWIIMWKWVGPIVMFIIFLGSVINEIVDPLKYTAYVNVSYCDVHIIARISSPKCILSQDHKQKENAPTSNCTLCITLSILYKILL